MKIDRPIAKKRTRVDHVWSNNGDHTIPNPVRGDRHSNTSGPDWQRKHFSDDDPSTRTPCRGKEKDVDANKRDLSLHGGWVRTVNGSCNGDDELANNHSECAPDEQWTATKPLDGPE